MSNTTRESIFWAKSGTTGSQIERDRRKPVRGQESHSAVAVLEAPLEEAAQPTSSVTPPRRDDRS